MNSNNSGGETPLSQGGLPKYQKLNCRRRNIVVCGADWQSALRERIAHFLRIEITDRTPEFIPLGIEEYEGGCKFKTVNRREFAADGFLDIQANKKDLVAKFRFELVHDGLNRSTCNSIG